MEESSSLQDVLNVGWVKGHMAVIEVVQNDGKASGGNFFELYHILLLLTHVVTKHGAKVVTSLGQNFSVGLEVRGSNLKC